MINLDRAIAGDEPWVESTVKKVFFSDHPITLVIGELRKSQFVPDKVSDAQIQRVVVWSVHKARTVREKETWRDRSTAKAADRRLIMRSLSRLANELNALAAKIGLDDSALSSSNVPPPSLAALVALQGKTTAYHLHEAAEHVNAAHRIVEDVKERQNRGKRGEKRSKAVEKELVDCLAQGWRRLGIPVQAYLHDKETKKSRGPAYGGAFVTFCAAVREAVRSIGGSELGNLSRLAVSAAKNDRK